MQKLFFLISLLIYSSLNYGCCFSGSKIKQKALQSDNPCETEILQHLNKYASAPIGYNEEGLAADINTIITQSYPDTWNIENQLRSQLLLIFIIRNRAERQQTTEDMIRKTIESYYDNSMQTRTIPTYILHVIHQIALFFPYLNINLLESALKKGLSIQEKNELQFSQQLGHILANDDNTSSLAQLFNKRFIADQSAWQPCSCQPKQMKYIYALCLHLELFNIAKQALLRS